jgi:uncharacterized membrane protein
MNPLERYYIKEYGSEKGYLLMLMQLALIVGLLISILSVFLGDNSYIFLQVIPMFLLGESLLKFRDKFKPEFNLYASFFIVFFLLLIIAPFVLRALTLSTTPFEMIRYSLYVVIAVLLLYVLFKLYLARRKVSAVVLMVDKSQVVVRVDFDLFSGIRAGKYVIESKGRKPKKGQTVKVLIRGGLFRRPVPYKLA